MEDTRAQSSLQHDEPQHGVRISGRWYVWDERVDAKAIAMKHAKDKAQRFVDLTTFGLLVVAAFGAALGFVFLSDLQFSALWQPSITGLAVSMALFFAAFLFYRRKEAARREKDMPERESKSSVPPVETLKPGEGVDGVNIARVFSDAAIESVEEAYQVADRFDHRYIHPIHMFIGTLASGEVSVVFGRLGLNFEQVQEPLQRRLMNEAGGQPTVFSDEVEQLLIEAFVNAYGRERTEVSPLELFFEAYKADEFVQELLYDLDVDEEKLLNVVEWIRITETLRERYESFREAAAFKPTGAMNRAMTSVVTPNLDAVSEDLTTAAVKNQLPLLIGRDNEMDALFRVIEGGGQSVVLVGPEGVGKSTMLAGVAERMVAEDVPDILKDKRLVSLSIPHLLSGSGSEAYERLMRVMTDVVKARNVVLAIPNIDQLVGVSSGQQADLAALVADILDRGVTFAIATTTPRAYTGKLERSVLNRVLQKVDVPEPDPNTAIHVLESKIGGIEYEHNVIFSYDAVDKAVRLTDRYMHEKYLPEKAVSVCKETALQVSKTKGKNAMVSGEDVADIVSSKTNIPVSDVSKDEKETLLNLEDKMHERMVDQEEAVSAVASALRRARAQLREGDRPIATFLFMGPTGVGKTELAKTIADVYFGDEEAMLRFDMSEYQDTDSIARLIGSPNSNQGGQLTEAVRKNPFSIVLLDEFEKANPDILNIFLQVFDDGRLTDAAGRTIDFTNTILVATSNAGAEYIQDAVERETPVEKIKTRLINEKLKGIYKPELLNRFDGVMVFKPLSMDDVTKIARLMIKDVAKQLEPKGIALRATDEAVSELAEKGYDPKFGARPLQRVIQEEVNDAIANALLEGTVERRDTIVLKEGGEITVEKAEAL